jgi:hypothetical protein
LRPALGRAAERVKLIDVVSCAATTRRPAHADTVRTLDASNICSVVIRGEDSQRCAATSPARLPATVRNTNVPVSTIRSNK